MDNDDLINIFRGANHDVKNYFSKLQGLLELTSMAEELGEDPTKYFNAMKRLIDEGSKITEYNTKHLGSDSMLNIQEFDSAKSTIDKVELYNLSDMKGNNMLYIGPVTLKVESDKSIYELVTNNLLSNADKYTNEGNILVNLADGRNHFSLSVHDSGKGIAKKDLESITDKFVSGSGSTGYGLYAVNEAIRKLGGDLKIESELGEGSKFTVILPKEYK